MMDPKVIKNADITASSIHSAPYAAFNGRLNLAPSAGVGGGWAVSANNLNQYLQVWEMLIMDIVGLGSDH